jgi:N-succinyldiaminopimelate aminotransferase
MRTDFLTTKLEGFGTSIFAEMSALAVATGAINLGQGFPDTDGHASVIAAATEAMHTGKGNQYPPGPGIPELRAAIADHQRAYYDIEANPDGEVLVTAGATEAITAALLAVLDTGDECILFQPFYDSYPAGVAMAGARVVPVTLHPYRDPATSEGSFKLDLGELRAAITPKTKMLIVNSPHNPTGTVFTPEEMAGIAAIAIEHDLIVISDEAYEHLTFDGVDHMPLCTYPGMWERTITVGSAGKTLSFTGWKIGWATGPEPLITAVRTAKQFLTYVSGGPFQYAVAHGLRTLGPEYFSGFAAELQTKRDRLAAGLSQVGFEVYQPKGTYFITTDVAGLGVTDALAFCRQLPHLCGVVAVPNSVFYATPGVGTTQVRFAFCKRFDVIDTAVDRLSGLQASLAKAQTTKTSAHN